MPKKNKFTIETPHGAFTRTTGNQYECMSLWKVREGYYGAGNIIDSWHYERNNVQKARYSSYCDFLGVYDVPQLPPEAWATKKKAAAQ
jgi:hypothetical protein